MLGSLETVAGEGLNPFHTGRGLSTDLRKIAKSYNLKSLNPFHTGRGLST